MLLVGMDGLRVKSLRARVDELPHRRIGVRVLGARAASCRRCHSAPGGATEAHIGHHGQQLVIFPPFSKAARVKAVENVP
jgi:hypothetical protein